MKDLPEELLELTGSVEDIIYRNSQNGYTVASLLCDGTAVTAVGSVTDVSVGDELRLIGRWKNHADYGEQFSFEFCEHKMPSTASSILKYLSSGAIKGIGKVMAKRIVEAFGAQTLEVMQNDPERLAQIKGITPEKARSMSEELKKIFGMREVLLKLEKYRISALEATRIWKAYGENSVSTIEEDPFVLCDERISISFERADAIAASLGKPPEDECRIRAGILHLITHNSRNGHSCLPRDILSERTASYLKLPEETVSAVLDCMTDETSLIKDIIDEKEFIFLPSLYRSETYCAGRLTLMLKLPPERITGGELALQGFEEERGISYAELQRKAITEALSGGLLILTGGPGTGKTTTLNAIIELYIRCGMKVLLAAPTGRAAQRMTEVTGREAKTIHRLLEVEWDNSDRPRFSRNERNLLDCDALILDEMSMVDASLFEGVMKALPLGCRLIMVGDSDQLPSVGAGNVLGDMIRSGKIPVVRLTEIFRQSMKSLIVTNAHRIVRGEMPEINHTDSDFFFMSVGSKEQISSTIVDLCARRLPGAYGFSPFDIQVLCPGRKTELGVTELNKKLQAALNPPSRSKQELRLPVYTFRSGDKVMQTKNNYDLPWTRDDGTEGSGVFNGDIGIIEQIDTASSSALIRFDDKLVTYNSDNIQTVELAYATTVHKSQGNEFDAVVMPMYYGAPQLYYRNLLYTAVTRAKKILVLVGNVNTLRIMVNNDKKTRRYSSLCYFLEKENDVPYGT